MYAFAQLRINVSLPCGRRRRRRRRGFICYK